MCVYLCVGAVVQGVCVCVYAYVCVCMYVSRYAYKPANIVIYNR